ncbi:hypothetical protein EPIR_0225 [Erwinia piriflorinigrans CFBP 5888]|uniref:Uncharacterized protein n=1 Tax=Erwinia piriflorinigrans CFBP 5888 TaxID=1161919 RepID=V5Z2W1_9GAMM|nr:hypothetical protein EPIR_0225 [Erwinia piriflorinigrans CFBP 5888]
MIDLIIRDLSFTGDVYATAPFSAGFSQFSQ